MREIILNNWQTQVAKDKSRFLVLNVGRRGGKSHYSALKMMFFAAKHERSIVYYVSPSYRQSKAIMWATLLDFIPSDWIDSKNETELTITYKNGSRIELKGADADPDRLRGVRIDFLVCDEVASFRNWDTVWNKVLRPTLVDSKGSAIFISTPQGFNFWYDLYNSKDPEYKAFTFTTYDNNYVQAEEIEKLKGELDEDTFRQEILAQFTQVSGVVYKEWDFARNYVPIAYDPKLPIEITIDFGVNDSTAIIWLQRLGGEFRAIDYYEASNANIDHYVQVIRSKPYREPSLVTGDPAGDIRSLTTNTSPIQEYAKHGIFVRTPERCEIAQQIRVTHKYIKSLYVANTFPRLRDCLHNYRYPTKKDNIVNQSNENPIHDEYSHAMRALEYYFLMVEAIPTENPNDQFPQEDINDTYY